MSRSIGDLVAASIGVTCEPGNLLFLKIYLKLIIFKTKTNS